MNEDRIFVKCAWRLIPFMALLYLVNYLDRVNVGFAALTMNKDLSFSPAVYGFGAGVFFLGYVAFQVPANVVLHRVGAKRTVFCILASWGAISALCALVQGPLSFYLLRFLLGVAEAGFFPGMLLYLTYWFPQAFRARYTACFQAAVPFAFVAGGPLAGFILAMDGMAGLHGWQWLFVLEGMPAVLLAFAVLRFFPDGPRSAAFLTPGEKDLIAARLKADDLSEDRDLWGALRDPRVIALGIAYLGNNLALFGVQFWLPQIVQAMGFSSLATGTLVAVPFLVSIPLMVLWGRSSDVRRERTWHVVIPMLLTVTGLIVASLSTDDRLVLLALGLAAIGPVVVLPLMNTLPGSFLGGAAAASGIAFYNSIGNISGFVGPFVVGAIKQASGGYAIGMSLLAFGSLVSIAIILALGRAIAPRMPSEWGARA